MPTMWNVSRGFGFGALGIVTVLLSLIGLGLFGDVTAPSVVRDSRATHGVNSNTRLAAGELFASELLKKQVAEVGSLDVGRSRELKTMSYIKDLFDAMDRDNDLTTSGDRRPIIRMRPGTVKAKRGVAGTRVQFRRYPKRGQRLCLAEIVIKEQRSKLQEMDEMGKIVAKFKSKRARTRVEAQRHKDYLIFNVSGIVDRSTRGIRLMYITSGNTTIPLSQSNEPLLVSYENMHENPLLKRRRPERDLRFPGARSATVLQPWHCQRLDWVLDMVNFNYDWYLYPMTFNAGMCDGQCPVPLEADILNITNYSFIKHLYHARTFNADSAVPRACCSPIAYESQSMCYINENADVVISHFSNMKVTACGCI